ncbi:P-domain proprotein convertase, putative [Trichomonas vaginalis G3]|uniref:p-domain proprotein convertase, putative n=1 Tax=Trichomonas vaginalis (strain ATCC PRA-98 / G3) TaxID=412133 RepID=A2E2I1_TRIV3|nr:proprotein convertase subtilisin/kexin-related family [Trichomonas vaginalis G3]EAY13156.1 P-domain proprotein convertase, putative [Trichomonas vaginalis G3]KAI5528270.1 proprotein convertase subtilisin/kexin-related family [Trichomonas vaginalis G3]|eukprot:XP_001325379.1 P-domain proprotein convertase [Trichomonas vaginalis G3]
MLFFLQLRIEPEWEYPMISDGYIKTAYKITNVFYNVSENLMFNPYYPNKKWDTIAEYNVTSPRDASNLRFLFIGLGFNKNDTRFTKNYEKEHDIGNRSIGDIADGSRLSEATASISIGVLPNYTILDNANFSYFWMNNEEVTKVDDFLTEFAKLTSNNSDFLFDIIVMSSTRGLFLIDQNESLLPYYRFDNWDSTVEKIIKANNTRKSNFSPIVIFRAGDEGVLPVDAQYNTLNYLPKTFLIGSSAATRGSAFYSQWSSGLLAVVPAGGHDTLTFGLSRFYPSINVAKSEINKDRPGYGSNIGTGIFAAVIAMMKIKYNHTKIDYRTVLYMVALTSTVIDDEHPMWVNNSASIMYNPAFGYGRINLDKLLDDETFNEINNLKGDLVKYTAYTNYSKQATYLKFAGEEDSNFTFNFPENTNMTRVETVQFSFYLEKRFYSDINIKIVSPSGTEAIIKQGGIGEVKGLKFKILPKLEYVILSREFLGEKPDGDWKVYIKHWNYIPVDRIWGMKLNFTGSNSHIKLAEHNKQSKHEKKPYVHDNKVNIKFADNLPDKTPRKCMELQTVTLNLTDLGDLYPDNISGIGTVYLSYYLRNVLPDGNKSSRIFDLRPKRINYLKLIESNYITNYSFVAPCILKNNSQIVMGVRNIFTNKSIETEKFNLINDHKIGLINVDEYDHYTNQSMEFNYSFHEDYFPEHGKPQFLQMSIYDLKKWEPIYAYTYVNNGSIYFNFSTLSRTVKKGVISLSAMTTTRKCSSIIYPFRKYLEHEVPDPRPKRPFKVRILYQDDESCNYDSTSFIQYPTGIFERRSVADYKYYVGEGINRFEISIPIVIHAAAIAIVIFLANFFRKNNDAGSGYIKK